MDNERNPCASEREFTRDRAHNERCEQQECYEIRCKGHLGDHWATWFEGLCMTHEEDGTTTLTGAIPDQPALFGLLDRVRDLGVALISVRKVDPNENSPER